MCLRHLSICAMVFVLASGPMGARAVRPRVHAGPGSQGAPTLPAALEVARQAVQNTMPAPEARDVDAAYTRSGGEPLWLDPAGRGTPNIAAAMGMLGRAREEGLDPADYRVEELAALAGRLTNPGAAFWEDAARLDALLTAGVLRYFRHVHLGRVDPRRLGLQLEVPDEGHDFPLLLEQALRDGRLAETGRELAPVLAQYEALKSALARYRALEVLGLESPWFPSVVRPGQVVTPGSLSTLHRLLTATGDLPAGTPETAGGTFDAVLTDAVTRFQARHGLTTDGVIGRTTQAALRVPIAWRRRQVELALERLRWLPDLTSRRVIAVNIPMFRLWAFDQVPSSDPPALEMDVIVGRALNTRTPVFAGQLQYVVFRPYWNVPSSILRGEMLPKIRRNPGYLATENLEIVDGPSDASPVLAPTLAHLAALGTGGVRLRQRPGPKNALGLLKFMFPNLNDVYMHGTPVPQLFAQARRDFSHGCIRVEDPAALAEWVFGREGRWPRARIEDAMNGASNQRVDLAQPIQVLIFYTTAVVDPRDGTTHFADDLYGHDRALDAAL